MGHPIPKITYGALFANTLDFDYPPSEGMKRETIRIYGKTSDSLSGVRQANTNYMEASRKFRFRFISETLQSSLENFITTWAGKGKTFRYYQDKTLGNFVVYELDQNKLEPKPITAVGVDTYIYEVEMAVRRVLGTVDVGGYVQQVILNNQLVALALPDLLLDSTQYKTVRIFYEISRKTGTNELVANGELVCVYHANTNTWSLSPGFWDGDPDYGVTFSITAGGQIKYTSTNLAGTNYVGYLLVREFTIVGG